MNDSTDPFELLQSLRQPAEPSAEEERMAFARLQHAITTDPTAAVTVRRPLRRYRLVPALSAIGLVAVAIAVLSVVRPGPAAATLAQIAQAARQAEPIEIPGGSFTYRQSEAVNLVVRPGSDLGLERAFVAYLLPVTQLTWRQPATRFYRSATTAHTPRFFDDEVAAAYQTNNGAALDRLGETVVEEFTDVADPVFETDWPTRPTPLRQTMQDRLGQGADTRPLDVQLFDLAGDILRDALDPTLRAAVLEVLIGLPVDIIEQHDDGSVTIATTNRTPPAVRDTLTITANGTLQSESSIWLNPTPDLGTPGGTTVSAVTHQPPRIVSSLPPT